MIIYPHKETKKEREAREKKELRRARERKKRERLRLEWEKSHHEERKYSHELMKLARVVAIIYLVFCLFLHLEKVNCTKRGYIWNNENDICERK